MSAGPRGYDANLSAPAESRAGAFKNVDELEGRGLRVFLRADPYLIDGLAGEQVPAPGAVSSTLRRLVEQRARVIVATQLSREFELETKIASIDELAEQIGQRLNVEVLLPDETLGDSLAKVTQDLRDGQICILPDLSKVADDANNTEAFARRLASYTDAYVGDAFSVCHLRHASLVRVPRLVGQRALGFHLQRELSVLSELGRAERAPLVLVVGGRRFSEKAELLNQWLPRTATVIAGGGVANTLLAAQGYALGQSEVEPERLAEARSFIERARALDVQLILPADLRVRVPAGAGWQPGSIVSPAARSGDESPGSVVRPGQIPDNVAAFDIGPDSVSRACDVIRQAKSLLWWGPLGRASSSALAESTRPLALAAGREELLSVVMGAELRRSLLSLEPEERSGFDLLTTGTEAAKAWLMGRRLSAVEVLRQP